jgi:hypothetical protein
MRRRDLLEQGADRRLPGANVGRRQSDGGHHLAVLAALDVSADPGERLGVVDAVAVEPVGYDEPAAGVILVVHVRQRRLLLLEEVEDLVGVERSRRMLVSVALRSRAVSFE